MTKKRKKQEFTQAQLEFIVKQFNKDFNTQFGEHFINSYIKGEGFDFDVFETQEEWEKYIEDVNTFTGSNIKVERYTMVDKNK